MIKEIDFKEIDGVSVGNAQNDEAKTGVTVFYFSEPAVAAVDISGGGPASRETPVIDVERADTPLNALVFAGGSAYGLAASDGVMRCLEEHKIGYDTRAALVPIVCQSDIYDLSYGRSDVRPDSAMGYEACKKALFSNSPLSGNIGAGTGATVGKICGMERCQKAGIGYVAFELNGLKVGAAVVLNAFGDIYFNGKKIAGLLSEDKKSFDDSVEKLFEIFGSATSKGLFKETSKENTTIGAVFTNGDFSKAKLKKIASMTRAAYDRCINPVGTMADGDTIYAVSVGNKESKVKFDINAAGTLAAYAMERAIKKAVESTK